MMILMRLGRRTIDNRLRLIESVVLQAKRHPTRKLGNKGGEVDIPHGGLKKTTSMSLPFPRLTSDSAYDTKSPSTNSILSATPRCSALCLASLSRIGLLSIAITIRNQSSLLHDITISDSGVWTYPARTSLQTRSCSLLLRRKHL